ncbi:hypothetical protein FQN50_009935 [Emmonsiellopsis sp. PD_5]|nr:hypothetical protein FQN50_009935 [Emmonsiellopsis sp. PD_5]
MSPLPDPAGSPSILTRWYIDTRQLTATTNSLPLLSTLQESDQKTVKAFYHLSDRHMSLASYLLKYLFIHRACRVPWDQIAISRTPAPHKRPCYIPPKDSTGTSNIPNIEFNVSHQASLVTLAGCIIPGNGDSIPRAGPSPSPSTPPQIGIDITCTDDPSRRHRNAPQTEEELAAFIDVFSEVFSQAELDDMKSRSRRSISTSTSTSIPTSQPPTPTPTPIPIPHRLRLFYTYWALKEAYIKMTGEALLAPWLRELEFRDVQVPSPPMSTSTSTSSSASAASQWGDPITSIKPTLHGAVAEDVRVEVVAFGGEYIFATAARGGGFGFGVDGEGEGAVWDEFRAVDIEGDVEACARGECGCLG